MTVTQLKVPVEGHSDLVRDINSGAIINMNVRAAELSKRRSKIITKQNVEIDTIGTEINILKTEMGEIKTLLKELIRDKNNG